MICNASIIPGRQNFDQNFQGGAPPPPPDSVGGKGTIRGAFKSPGGSVSSPSPATGSLSPGTKRARDERDGEGSVKRTRTPRGDHSGGNSSRNTGQAGIMGDGALHHGLPGPPPGGFGGQGNFNKGGKGKGGKKGKRSGSHSGGPGSGHGSTPGSSTSPNPMSPTGSILNSAGAPMAGILGRAHGLPPAPPGGQPPS